MDRVTAIFRMINEKEEKENDFRREANSYAIKIHIDRYLNRRGGRDLRSGRNGRQRWKERPIRGEM